MFPGLVISASNDSKARVFVELMTLDRNLKASGEGLAMKDLWDLIDLTIQPLTPNPEPPHNRAYSLVSWTPIAAAPDLPVLVISASTFVAITLGNSLPESVSLG